MNPKGSSDSKKRPFKEIRLFISKTRIWNRWGDSVDSQTGKISRNWRCTWAYKDQVYKWTPYIPFPILKNELKVSSSEQGAQQSTKNPGEQLT